MKNMKLLLLLFIAAGLTQLSAQKVNSGIISGAWDQNNRFLDMVDDFEAMIDAPIDIDKLEGSPYLDDTFRLGKIFLNNTNMDFMVRYNIYNDVMEVYLDDDQEIMEVNKLGSIKVFIDGRRFKVYDVSGTDKGYFEVLESTDEIDLLVRYTVELIPGEKPKSSYHRGKNPKIERNEEYYFKLKDAQYPQKIEKLKDKYVINVLSSNFDKAKIERIIKERKLNLKEIDDVKALVSELQ